MSEPRPGPSRLDDESMRESASVNCHVTKLSPFHNRLRINSSLNIKRTLETELTDNDDEAERLSRRENLKQNRTSSVSNSTLNLSESIPTLSTTEIGNQITECLKLSAENRISIKNAFQLKMIDLLFYSLKKEDAAVKTLQTWSAYLDASGKIYGHRVDKVHSDLLKIVGGKQAQNEENEAVLDNQEQRPRKKRRINKQNILSTVDALKGNIETVNASWMDFYRTDVLTSDKLFQSGFPQHFNEGVALNIYKGVTLDRLMSDKACTQTVKIKTINDFTTDKICSSYDSFSFLDWSDNKLNENTEEKLSDVDYRFNLDHSVDDNVFENNKMMDYRNDVDGNVLNNEQNITQSGQRMNDDLQEIIENQQDPDTSFEYSYVEPIHHDSLAGPSYWKVKFNRNYQPKIKECHHQAKRRRKEIVVSCTPKTKEESSNKFINGKLNEFTNKTVKNWEDEKQLNLQVVLYNPNNFFTYFLKPFHEQQQIGEFSAKNLGNTNSQVPISNLNDDFGYDNEDQEQNRISNLAQAATSSQEAFIGDNLVAVPRTVEKIFVNYAQREKRVNIRNINSALWKSLTPDTVENFCDKKFSEIFKILPTNLGKSHEVLSLGMAFVSLLDVAHKKNLIIENYPTFDDLRIKHAPKQNFNESKKDS